MPSLLSVPHEKSGISRMASGSSSSSASYTADADDCTNILSYQELLAQPTVYSDGINRPCTAGTRILTEPSVLNCVSAIINRYSRKRHFQYKLPEVPFSLGRHVGFNDINLERNIGFGYLTKETIAIIQAISIR